MAVGIAAMARHTDAVEFSEEEYVYHLLQAQHHIRRALDQVDRTNGPKRSGVAKSLLRRAHGILTGLYIQEAQYKRGRR